MANRCRNLSFFPCVKTALEDKKVRDCQEYLCIAALYLLFELRVLLAGALDQLAKADQLLPLVLRHKMSTAEAPGFLEARHQMHQLWVIPQLRIDHFNVLRVPLQEQILHIVEAALDVRAQLSHGHALTCTDLTAHLIGDNEDGDIEIVSSLPNAVGHLVDLADLSKELVSKVVVLFIRGRV